MGVSLPRGDGEDKEEKEPQRWGLQWDTEEGPVWGKLGDGQKQEDVWSQLIQEGVNGITTDSDGKLLLHLEFSTSQRKRQQIFMERLSPPF